MSNFSKSFVLLFLLAASASLAWADVPITLNVDIVKADSQTWLANHAANELANYIEQMTGATTQIIDVAATANNAFTQAANLPEMPNTQPQGDVVFTLSLTEHTDRLKNLPGGDDPRRLRDGFVIQSQPDNKVLIAATEPIGLLYGVYQYLEKYCGCGFFWDGDYVPQRSSLPTENIDIAVLPRWSVRHFGLSSQFGLAKWHDQFRTPEHRKTILDWMAKRKINWSYHYFDPHISKSGMASTQTFGLDDTQPDNFTFSGWPGALGWPAKVRTDNIKMSIEYGRQRGIKRIYYVPYGAMPHQFRQMHPDYNYVTSLGYSVTALYPEDPECARWSGNFYKNIIDIYDTDNVYCDTPFCESSGASSPEESFKIKLAAAQRMCETLKKIDKDATWQSDSWDFVALPGLWTPERIEKYYAALPKEMMKVYDTTGTNYKRTNYFWGTRWQFGILHSFQGDDHLHGDLKQALNSMQELSADPKADKCEGIYHVPESTGHNVLFFDMTTNLAWNPEGVTLNEYLDEYTRRRFGAENFAIMRPAIDALVQSVYSGSKGGGDQMPIYQKLGCPYGPPTWWPIVDGRPQNHPAQAAQGIIPLQHALQLALASRSTQSENDLYVNDMVDWSRQYLSNIFNWATLSAYTAFKDGQLEEMNKKIAIARDCLKHIEAILSTRPDFSLQKQIDWAMQVPGSNPHLPWYMKQHCVNDLYSSNEVYEQLHYFYAPRMEVYFTELEKRAEQGLKNISWDDIKDNCEVFRKRWLESDITVPQNKKFPGTTTEAIINAYRAFESVLEKSQQFSPDDIQTKKSDSDNTSATISVSQRWAALFNFLQNVEKCTGDSDIEKLRKDYQILINEPELASRHSELTAKMATAEKKTGNIDQAISLMKTLSDPFALRELYADIAKILNDKPADPLQPTRPLLVTQEDGSTDRVKKDQRWCITTQKLTGRMYIYFALPPESALKDADNSVDFNITYYTDGSPNYQFQIQYDSHTGPYSTTDPVIAPQSPGWHNTTVTCPRAQFASSQNSGADFRIAASADQDIFISNIQIQKTK